MMASAMEDKAVERAAIVTTDALRESDAEVERLKGKLEEEARWVYDTGQRAKDALAEVERLREAMSQVHQLAEKGEAILVSRGMLYSIFLKIISITAESK